MSKTASNFNKALGIFLMILGIATTESLRIPNTFTRHDFAGLIICAMGVIVYGISEWRSK